MFGRSIPTNKRFGEIPRMADTSDDAGDDRYATRGGSVYHSSLDCERINKPARYHPRSEQYIAHHDLEACRFCHETPVDQRQGER